MVKCNIIDVNTVNLVCDRSYFVKFYWIIYMLHLKVNKKVIMLIAGLFSCFTALFVFANSNTVSVGAAPTVVNGLDKEQLKKFKEYVAAIDIHYWLDYSANTTQRRKIPVPTFHQNLVLVFDIFLY